MRIQQTYYLACFRIQDSDTRGSPDIYSTYRGSALSKISLHSLQLQRKVEPSHENSNENTSEQLPLDSSLHLAVSFKMLCPRSNLFLLECEFDAAFDNTDFSGQINACEISPKMHQNLRRAKGKIRYCVQNVHQTVSSPSKHSSLMWKLPILHDFLGSMKDHEIL